MSKWWKSVTETWRRVLQKDSNLQKEIDTYRLLLALTHREVHKEDDSVKKALARADAIADSARESEVQNKVHAQVQMIMARLATEAGILSEEESSSGRGKAEAMPVEYGLEVKESRIRGAGMGLFMKGNCPAGSVVAFVPGRVFFEQHLRHLPGFPTLQDPKHMLARGPRGSLIDPYPVVLKPLPLAGGHYVNHAGGSGAPENVMPVPYTFGPRLPPWVRGLVPTEAFAPPRGGQEGGFTGSIEHALESSLGMKAFGPFSGHLPAQVLVSLLPIADGEEVLLDYRFNPKLKADWPEWYEVLDPEATDRRWDMSSF